MRLEAVTAACVLATRLSRLVDDLFIDRVSTQSTRSLRLLCFLYTMASHAAE